MTLFSRLADWLWPRNGDSGGGPPEPARSQGAAGVACATLTLAPFSEPDIRDAQDVAEAVCWWSPSGASVLCEPPPREDLLDPTLRGHVVAVLSEPDLDLPRMPRAAQQALALLRDTSFSPRELARVIEEDPVLTAEVLRRANSAAYRGAREITRLEPAFVRLGQRGLRSLVMAATVKTLAIRVSNGDRSLGQELWQRSVASGVVCSQFAERAGISADDGQVIGLLHDIGNMALLRVIHDYQKEHGRRVSRDLYEFVSCEWHEHIGLRMADAWNLPSPLPELIGNHHREPVTDDPLAKVRRLVQFSDAVTSLLDYAPRVPYDLLSMDCSRALGIRDDRETAAALHELPALIESRLETE